MIIRKANLKDFKGLYEIGKNTPELKVSSTEDFMDKDEFKWSITNRQGIFLVAEEKDKILGFIYANAKDIERPFKNKYACLVYLVVMPEFRGIGIATKLYKECARRLKKVKIKMIYGWANEKSGIIGFLKTQGFKEGHKYAWMDRKL